MAELSELATKLQPLNDRSRDTALSDTSSTINGEKDRTIREQYTVNHNVKT